MCGFLRYDSYKNGYGSYDLISNVFPQFLRYFLQHITCYLSYESSTYIYLPKL